MELFIGLLIFVIGARFGYKYREHTALKLMMQLQEEEVQAEVDTKIAIKVEKMSDIWYVYKEDGTFMAQGNTWEEVTDRIAERYPKKRFVIDPDNARHVGLNL